MRGAALTLLVLFIVISAAGKLGPTYVVSRRCGLEPRPSAVIAVLINTGGLTELIALSIGLTNGLIHQRLFTVLVLMALVNTLITAPLLSRVRPATVPEASTVTAPVPEVEVCAPDGHANVAHLLPMTYSCVSS